MTNLAEQVGWLAFLLFVMTVSGLLAKGLLKMVWDESAQGNVVDTTDALIALVMIVVSWFQLARSNWLATVCTVAVYLLMLGSTSVSVYASIGYSVVTFVITAHFTPLLKRRLKTSAKASSTQASQPEQSSDS